MSKSHFLFNLLQSVNLLQFTNRYKEKISIFASHSQKKKMQKKSEKTKRPIN